MRIIVIGGSGHIGSFLIPRLVRGGHQVVNISRGTSNPYVDAPEWQQVEQVVADRQREDAEGSFPDRLLGLGGEVVIDLVCFTLDSAAALVERLRGQTGHYLFCGSIWSAGASQVIPMSEENTTEPFGEYGIGKYEIARMLKQETASGGLVTTSLHPGHISGPGWAPIGPTGNLDPTVWTRLSSGEPIRIPGLGAETMAHVHADDVAQSFECAVEHRDEASGEEFYITAADALNVRGYATLAASWFGRTPVLESVSWAAFREGLTPEHADASWQHLVRSQSFTMQKAQRLLGYAPKYSAGGTVQEAVRWLVDHGQLEVASPLVG
ncbi:NAD-dependent epimerase/dehydratase family protein [Aestuariimicrobium kwangyangense]|uniref:NAD-dependent epimerase/dehydratase family protein n=1 Tax=Aestuariimicrobium kwangyangense TaxID=396389 RepID=UPI0003B536F7|nr:NAD-dependent epimerase/dehydratase family protein [Aestuariimicrobium kwangyangense]